MVRYPALRIVYSALDVDCPGTHGGSTHVAEAVTSLTHFCSRVYLLCHHRHGQRWIESKDKLTYVRLPIPVFSFFRVPWYFFISFFISFFLLLFGRATAVYERARIFGGGAVIAAWICRKPSIYELIEPYATIPVLLGQYSRTSLTWRLLWMWHHFACSLASLITVTHTSSLEGISHNRILFIHTGANPTTFRPNLPVQDLRKTYDLTSGNTLLYVGSFSRWHALEYLLRAVARLVKTNASVKLLLVGQGEKYASCFNLIQKLHLQNHVFFLGARPLSEIPRYINASDICLALFDRTYPPFRKLGYYYSPIKVHEYKSCGKALVVSDYPLLRELVHDSVHGYTVDETNVPVLTKTLQNLLGHKALLQRIGSANRRDVLAHYTWDYFTELILKTLLANRKFK